MNTRGFLLILIGLSLLSCSHKKQVQFQKPPSSPAPSNSNSLPESSKSNSPKAHNLLPLLSEIDVLDPPKGVTPELFSKLKAELEKIILERRNASLAGEKVAAQMGASPVLFVSQGKLSWEEVREGDWNNDGIVKADDLIPIAIHFGAQAQPLSPSGLAQVAGGSRTAPPEIGPEYKMENTESRTVNPQLPTLNSVLPRLSSGASLLPWEAAPLSLRAPKGRGNLPSSANYYKYAEYVDGDGDGIIGIGDVAAIADHFGESTIGYNIYEALDEAGLSSSKVATVLRPSPPADPDNPPWNISFATLEYDTSSWTSLPSSLRQVAGGSRTAPTVLTSGASSVVASEAKQSLTIPPNWSPTPGKFYSVVPYGQSFDEQGEPIVVERFNLASNWAYINIPPVAVLKATPDTGEAPMTVEFDASESYDADGYVTNYVWDFDGDGLTDSVTQTPITTYEFTGPSINPAQLLVYDNAGIASPITPLQLHISGWKMVIIKKLVPGYAGHLIGADFKSSNELVVAWTNEDGITSLVYVRDYSVVFEKLLFEGENTATSCFRIDGFGREWLSWRKSSPVGGPESIEVRGYVRGDPFSEYSFHSTRRVILFSMATSQSGAIALGIYDESDGFLKILYREEHVPFAWRTVRVLNLGFSGPILPNWRLVVAFDRNENLVAATRDPDADQLLIFRFEKDMTFSFEPVATPSPPTIDVIDVAIDSENRLHIVSRGLKLYLFIIKSTQVEEYSFALEGFFSLMGSAVDDAGSTWVVGNNSLNYAILVRFNEQGAVSYPVLFAGSSAYVGKVILTQDPASRLFMIAGVRTESFPQLYLALWERVGWDSE